MRLFVILILIGLLIVPAAAQDEPPTWRHAFQFDGLLVAYTLDGKTHPLIEDEPSMSAVPIVRTGPESGIAKLYLDEGREQLFLLTPQTVYPLQEEGEDEMWQPVAANHEYAVLQSDDAAPPVLVNTQTGEWERLPYTVPDVPYFPYCALEAPYLRCVGTTEDFDLTLWERDLTTGEDRAAHDLAEMDGEEYPLLQPALDGAAWFTRLRDDEETAFVLFHADGSTEVLAAFSTPTMWLALVEGRGTMTVDISCEADCVLVYNDFDGARQLEFPQPRAEFFPQPMRWVDEEHLLVQDGDSFWLLGPDEALELGWRGAPTVIWPENLRLSPDGRYFAATDADEGPSALLFWDLLERRIVSVVLLDDIAIYRGLYGPHHVLLAITPQGDNDDEHHSLWIDLRDGEPIRQSGDGYRVFEILPDGTMLRRTDAGLVLLDPTTGDERPVLDGTWQGIPFPELRQW